MSDGFPAPQHFPELPGARTEEVADPREQLGLGAEAAAAPDHVAAGPGEPGFGADAGAGAARGSANARAGADDFNEFTAYIRNHAGVVAEAMDKVASLKEEQRKLACEKKRVSMDIRNEKKKRARRIANSSKLSTMDLVSVLEDRKLREDARAAAKAKAKAGAR